MNAKQIGGMLSTFLGIILMFYSYIISLMTSSTPKIQGDHAYMFVLGTVLLLIGPGLWIGEVPKEVIARVKTQALGAKKEEEKK